jgi:hypothetical protein
MHNFWFSQFTGQCAMAESAGGVLIVAMSICFIFYLETSRAIDHQTHLSRTNSLPIAKLAESTSQTNNFRQIIAND